MNALFKCETVHTKELMHEYYEYCFFKKPAALVCHVILAAALIFWGYIRMTGGEIGYLIPIAVIVYYGMMLYCYYASVNVFMKRSREIKSDGLIRAELAVYPEHFEYSNGAAEPTVVGYDEVKKVFGSKNFIAVQTKAKIEYIFQRSGFTVGTDDAFLQFLSGKGLYKKKD